MTAGAPLPFPGSRVLAGWWHVLAPWQPQALWVGHLLLHHIEALVTVRKPLALDRFHGMVLQALTLAEERTVGGVDRYLHVGTQFLEQALGSLARAHLAQADATGGWEATNLGRQALREGAYTQRATHREIFHFLQDASARPPRPEHLLPLKRHASSEWSAGADWHFDPNVLSACAAQSAQWKERHGFSADIEAVHLTQPGHTSTGSVATNHGASTLPWQHVIVDRPERLVVALVGAAAPHTEQVIGFEAIPDGWSLNSSAPAFALDREACDAVAELMAEPALEAWRHAWRAWCQQQGIARVGLDRCQLERRGHHLHVTVPDAIGERLRNSRSEVLRGETWVLAGTGLVRAAAALKVHEEGGSPSS